MPTNALDYITIRGFKSIAAIEKLPLRACNVLIGANGSGKSNFIEVFALLHDIVERPLRGALQDYAFRAGGAEKVLHFGSKITKRIDIDLGLSAGFGQAERTSSPSHWQLTLAPTSDDSLYLYAEGVYREEEGGVVTVAKVFTPRIGQEQEAGIKQDTYAIGPEVWEPIRTLVGGWRLYHVHDTSSTSPMRKTAKVDDNEFLRPDGSNLAAFLYFLREKHEPSYRLIRRTVQRVAPFFEDFRLKPRRLKAEDIKLEWKHKSSDQYFDASSLSDGTLRFIALATLFLQPKEYLPSVILVDEPELGLHPYAIEMLTSLVRAASKSTQVIVSTQSSLLLDHLDPEDVLVANRVDGGTQITRLESARLVEWLKDYSLGQLWEKGEFAGRPTRE
jgi:predicted ATPase